MTNTINILQYNINGLFNNIADLKLLNNNYKFAICCLQETHTNYKTAPSVSGFNIVSNYKSNCDSTQGVAILLKSNIPFENIKISSNLQIVAIRAKLPLPVTICSIYLHPNLKISEIDIQAIIDQIPRPFMILGDFNAHSPLWGSEKRNYKGKVIEDIINTNHVGLLNDGTPTYLHPATGTWSNIDLSIVDVSLIQKFYWRVLPQMMSDHSPIVISYKSQENCSSSAIHNNENKINFNKINWDKFEKIILNIEYGNSDSIDTAVEIFTGAIHAALMNSQINQKYHKHQKSVPWWTKEINILFKKKEKALQIFSRNPNTENKKTYFLLRREFRDRVVKEKHRNWTQFVNSIDDSTKSVEVWKKINNISGKKPKSHSILLDINNTLVADPLAVSNELAKTFVGNNPEHSEYQLNMAFFL